MKKILFFSLITACLFSFGKCTKKKKCPNKKEGTETSSAKLNIQEVWMQYDETKCDNPWQLNWFKTPTEEQVLGAVKSDLLGKEIAVLDIQSRSASGFISCEACNCPNGRHFYVRVNKSEIEKLKALKFYIIDGIPQINKIDNTK